ncbi:MAG: secretion system protein E, partial [Planctomycetes bacterium DG_58]
AGLLPPEFCRTNLVLPLRLEDGLLTIAMADPSDIFKRENLEMLLGLRLNVVMAKGKDLEQRIGAVYGALPDEAEAAPDVMEEIDIVIEDTQEETNVEELLTSSGVPPVVRVVHAVLSEALRRGASDIHIEPRLKYTAVRFRIDGLLQDRMRLPPNVQAAVASRIKVLAKMDIAEKRRPQDGRITVRAPERMVDLRVSTLPTMHGENIVLRLLDLGGTVRHIEALGLDPDNLERVRKVVRRPQGILICTGPTGSGKTTMLYSLLREHLRPTSSYGTIEDPVEYYIESAAQVHVREKTGLSFPVALRSMLRQDPDVILVGEIRDRETAQIAFQAALTGHLVLSTLHTNSAVATVTRLVNLGVERYLIASGIEAVIAQRLLRALCERCRRPTQPEGDVLRLLDLRPEEVGEIQKGVGCEHCNQTGYVGRSGVFEVLEFTDRLRELILAGSRQSELLEVARDDGMRTLFEDALGKVQAGLTTLDEVLRVLGPRAVAGRPCPGCAGPLEPTFAVCPLCGYEVRRLCPKCSTHLVEEWKYCPTCGRPCNSELEECTTGTCAP